MSQDSLNKPHFYYLDLLRIISCFLIVGVHVSALNWNDVAVSTSHWQIMNLYDCICILGVPLFFMMSGALFLQESSSLQLKKLYLKNILRLFLVYHIWLLFYNVLPFLRGELAFTIDNFKYELLDKFLCGIGIYHLWFLPELIILYMLSPILKEAFRKKEICQYFLVLYALFGAFLPMILQYYFPYRKYVSSYYERTSLVMLTGYLGYFVLGHYLHTFGITVNKKSKRLLLWGVVCIGCIITITACSIDALKKNQPSTILNTPFSFASLASCFGIFALCKYYCRNLTLSSNDWLHQFASLTFGIYLLHPFMLQIIEKLGITTLQPHPALMIPVLIILVSAMCIIPTWLLRKIPFLRTWLL